MMMTDRRFFFVAPPGLEPLLELELKAWAPELVIEERGRGGIEVCATMARGIALARRTKIASRVLLRLADFGCRDFPKLFKKTRGLPWRALLPDGARVEFDAVSHNSRLKLKRRIAETCDEGARKSPGVVAPSAGADAGVEPFKAFVRFVDDVCFLSLDLTGELLHRRGLRTRVGAAPLRENLAAACLMALAFAPNAPPHVWTDRSIELFDPMAGSGAFLLEAMNLRETIHTRGFAFERMRPFVSGEWAESVLECGDRLPKFTRAIGWDFSDRAVAAASANLNDACLSTDRASISKRDFYECDPLLSCAEGSERWTIVNPPYGERLDVRGGLSKAYSELALRLEVVAQPARAGFLLPSKAGDINWPHAWKSAGPPVAFSNGGIPVVLHRFNRKNR